MHVGFLGELFLLLQISKDPGMKLEKWMLSHWKKLEVTKTGYFSSRIYTAPHFYHFYYGVGLQPLCTQSSNMG